VGEALACSDVERRMENTRVFLSYARSDISFAQALHDELEAQQIEVWWDQEQVLGEDWMEQILAWIKGADSVLVVVSRHSVRSLSVKNEVMLAQDYQVAVIPILLEQAEGGLWMVIRSLQWIDVRNNQASMLHAAHTLRERLARLGGTRAAAVGEAPVYRPAPPPPSEARALITISLPGDLSSFDEREREALTAILRRLADLPREAVKIERVEQGSVLVTLELPESTARWLFSLSARNEPLIQLLDIQAVRILQVLDTRPARAARPALPQAQGGNWRSWRTWLSPAFATAMVLLLALNISQQQRIAGLIAAADERTEIIKDARGNDDALQFALASPDPALLAQGQLWIAPGERALALYGKDLAAPPEGSEYQLWLEQDGRAVSVGTFGIDAEERAWFLARPPQLPAQPQRAFVTVEPVGGSAAPSGPVILQGAIE
jgi:anti-sigma-K factor RskA